MKTTLPIRVWHFAAYLLLLVALSTETFGQTTYMTAVDPPNTYNTSRPYSPSITSYFNGSTHYLLCAYAYQNAATTRTVGFSRSTDNGDSWSTLMTGSANLALPVPSSISTMTNFDDPQILCIGDQTLVCVVRAWGSGSGEQVGSAFDEQSGSIYLNSKILLYVSPDGGDTWGYYDSYHSFQSGTCKIVSEDGTGSDEDGYRFTVEHPRIAFRPGFDNKGYVIWHRKSWDYDQPSSGDAFRVVECKIGLCAFSVGNSITSDGEVYPHATGGSYYLSISGSGSISDASYTPGPEKPSVASAPDSSIWIGFHKVFYKNSRGSVSDWAGIAPADADWYATRATCTINYYLGSPYTSFSVDNPVVYESKTPVCGVFDKNRGYFYSQDWTPTVGSYRADIAYGPSIQVADADPTSCQNFQVGIVHVTGEASVDSYGNNTATTTLHFYAAPVLHFHTASDWGSAISTSPNTVESDESGSNYTVRLMPVLKYVNVKDQYLTAKNLDLAMNKITDVSSATALATNALPRSYFVLGYLRGYRADNPDLEDGMKYYTSFLCKTASSFDNQSFVITKTDASTASYVMNAQETFTSGIAFNTTWFGTKFDIDGTSGDFTFHPMWHEVLDNFTDPSHSHMESNRAVCILAKPYLENYPANDPEAFPIYSASGTGFLRTDLDGSTPLWSTYGYVGYRQTSTSNYLGQPQAMSAVNSYSPSACSGISIGSGVTYVNSTSGSNNSFNGSTSLICYVSGCTAYISSGIYYANYTLSGTKTFGELSYSDQRKVVMTGDILHTVSERSNEVYYTQGSVKNYSATKKYLVPVPLNVAALSDNAFMSQKRPSIAVYQKGDGTGSCGETAIAATWVEFYNVPGSGNENLREARIMMRTREFNICDGLWNSWSDVYTIHSHIFDGVNAPSAHEDAFGDDDGTTPVIVPLVGQPAAVGSGATKSSNLLGWTITWTSPQLKLVSAQAQVDLGTECTQRKVAYAVSSRSWLRGYNTGSYTFNQYFNNEYWGTFLTSSKYAHTAYAGLQPISTHSPFPWNELRTWVAYCDWPDEWPIAFPTAVSTETKGNDAIYQDVAYSTDGNSVVGKIWDITASYVNTSTTSPVGTFTIRTGRTRISSTTVAPPSSGTYVNDLWTRNPCITVNSKGQRFVSWEEINFLTRINAGPPPTESILGFRSMIPVVRSDYRSGNWVPAGKRDILTIFSTGIIPNQPRTWWLQNPSITAFPKSHLVDFTSGLPYDDVRDHDPAAVELGYVSTRMTTAVPAIRACTYSENRNDFDATTGSWKPIMSGGSFVGSGRWAQRSAGMYEAGPTFALPTTIAYVTGKSWITGNTVDIGGFENTSPYAFVNATGGVYFKGTYDATLGSELYRTETRIRNGVQLEFIWGDVYVGDTSTGLPLRQVILHQGERDSGFTTFDEMRDSIFRTEVFDWPAGATLSMYRGLYTTDSGSTTLNPALDDSSLRMEYIMELVNVDSNTSIPIQRLVFRPWLDSTISLATIHLTNNSTQSKNVFIRVRGIMSGLSDDADSGSLAVMIADTLYPSYSDTTFTLYKKIALNNSQGKFIKVFPVYPDPVSISQNKQVIEEMFAPKGTQITLRLVNILGSTLYEKATESDGSAMRFEIPAPTIAGSYFLVVQGAGESVTMPISVIK